MKIRADFDFKEEAMGIKACKGYVIGEFTPTEEGGDFKPEDVILERLVAKSPDLKKIEAMAIANCKVLYDDNEVEEVINVGSLQIITNRGQKMFASVWVKDYTIDLDGKPFVVKGERWLGLVQRKDGQATGEEPYFSGMAYDWDEEKQCYVDGAHIVKTKEEFEAEAERITYFK